MKSLKCDYVLDFIDNFDFKSYMGLEIETHLKECEDCRKYYGISKNLRLLCKVDKIDVREEFFKRLKRKPLNLKLVFAFSMILIVIVSVLWFRPFDVSNGTNYNSKNISSESSDSLDYYYTIALEM